jgi:hypothetical protein
MLSHNDVHYIVGFLHAITRRDVDHVILGERVYDAAAAEERDVDITMLTAGQTGFAGVEVKDESRPLDVTLIESLCLKLADMPDLTARASSVFWPSHSTVSPACCQPCLASTACCKPSHTLPPFSLSGFALRLSSLA